MLVAAENGFRGAGRVGSQEAACVHDTRAGRHVRPEAAGRPVLPSAHRAAQRAGRSDQADPSRYRACLAAIAVRRFATVAPSRSIARSISRRNAGSPRRWAYSLAKSLT